MQAYLSFLIWEILINVMKAIVLLVVCDFWCEKRVKVSFPKYSVEIKKIVCVRPKTLEKPKKSKRASVCSRCPWPTHVLVSSKLHVSQMACCYQIWAVQLVIAYIPVSTEEERLPIVSFLVLISFLSCWFLARPRFTEIDMKCLPILSHYGNLVAKQLTFQLLKNHDDQVLRKVSMTIWIRITEDKEIIEIIGESRLIRIHHTNQCCYPVCLSQKGTTIGAVRQY